MIARLSVQLALDSGEFLTGTTKAQNALRGLADKVTNIGQSMTKAGKSMTVGMTVPLVGVGAAVIKVAADFETGMKGVQIATEATAAEMSQMKQIALEVGNATTFGASEAASAMEMLAKAGISTKVIIGGAAKAVTDLAAAAGSDLDPAASAISDSIAQFKLNADQLPTIVNQITGAVNESKFGFADFTGGMAQAGGVAASSGLSFKDFAATLAATSSQFASGSDAGTSLKTFLLSLTPTTKKAAATMEKFGLSFFDAAGNMRPVAEIAEQLRSKFAGLSDEARNTAFKDMFGTDAIRTAVGLMNQGADGIDRISAKLANTSAADQAAKQMGGLSGQIEQLKGAFETLAIAIADTGLLTAFTSIVKAVAGFVSKLSQTSPTLLKVVVGLAALAAALGPLMIVMGTLASVILPAFLIGMGPIGIAVSALINPLGTVIAILGRMALAWAATSGIMAAGFSGAAAALAPVLVPLAGLAALGYTIYTNWDKIAPVLQGVWDTLQKTIGPALTELIASVSAAFNGFFSGPLGTAVKAALTSLDSLTSALLRPFGPAIIAGFQLLGQTVANVLDGISSAIRAVTALFNGDWKTTLTFATGLFNRLFGGLPDFAINAMQKLVNGVRDWLVNKMDLAGWVRDKVEAAKKQFFSLYDAVVGHSYIPDMVDGIAEQMKRLDGVMVDPVKRATGKATEAFRKLASDVKGLLDQLFPEFAKLNELRSNQNLIAKGVKGGAISPDLGIEAQDRLIEQNYADRPSLPEGTTPAAIMGWDESILGMQNFNVELTRFTTAVNDNLPNFSALPGIFERIGLQSGELRQELASAFTDVILGAQSFGGAMRNVFNRMATKILDNLINNLLGNLLGGIIPGFATGTPSAPRGMAWVGERGPELVNFRGGERVWNSQESERMARGGTSERNLSVTYNDYSSGGGKRPSANQIARETTRQLNGPLRRAG